MHGRWWAVQKPGVAASPRYTGGKSAANSRNAAHESVIRSVGKAAGIQFANAPKLSPIPEWTKVEGSDFRVAFAETKLGGVDGVAFIIIKKPRRSNQFEFNIIEMPRQTFVEWGGAARMMVIRGLLPKMSVFPREHLRTIANGSMPQQTKFYQAAATKFFNMKMAQTYPMTQSNLLNGMQELNYDLLFGNDIGTSVIY